MNDTIDRPDIEQQEIVISMHMIDGNIFVQRLPMENADFAECLLEWYRNPKKFSSKTWTWRCINDQTVHIFQHSHIIAIDIEGFIEPDGRNSRWYERWLDKIRIGVMLKWRKNRSLVAVKDSSPLQTR